MKRSLWLACLGAAPWLVIGVGELFVRTHFPNWVWVGCFWTASPILALTAILLAIGEHRTPPSWQSWLAIGLSVIVLIVWGYAARILWALMQPH